MGRTVVMYIAMSLDGFLADRQGGVGWIQGHYHDAAPDDDYSLFIRDIDMLLMGYTTYRQIVTELSPGLWPYQGIKSYVFSRTHHANTEDVSFVSDDVSGFVQSIREGRIWLVGGAKLVEGLLRDGLIDEMEITIVPTLLGGGTRLFPDTGRPQGLRLKSTSANNGLITLRYDVLRTKNRKKAE